MSVVNPLLNSGPGIESIGDTALAEHTRPFKLSSTSSELWYGCLRSGFKKLAYIRDNHHRTSWHFPTMCSGYLQEFSLEYNYIVMIWYSQA